MRSKVLLISPNRCTVPEAVFPLGLAHIQEALQEAGHETRLLDSLADLQSLEDVLREFQPDYIGVSLRNIYNVLIRKQETFFESLNTICETVRRVHPRPIVIGWHEDLPRHHARPIGSPAIRRLILPGWWNASASVAWSDRFGATFAMLQRILPQGATDNRFDLPVATVMC